MKKKSFTRIDLSVLYDKIKVAHLPVVEGVPEDVSL